MKKRQPSKSKRPTSILSKQGTYKKNTPSIHLNSPGQPPLKYKQKTKTNLLDRWKNIWAILGPAMTLLGAGAYWWPSVGLATGINLDPSQDFQTQFVITNTGHVPVHDVSFVCTLVGSQANIGDLQSGPRPAPISTLKPGEPASRGCFAKSLNIDGPMLRVDAYYRWPIINRIVSTRSYFAVRRGASGKFLVPEATPSPEPSTLYQIGRPPG